MKKLCLILCGFIIMSLCYDNTYSVDTENKNVDLEKQNDCDSYNPDPNFHIFKYDKGNDSKYSENEKVKTFNIRANNGTIYKIIEICSNGTTYFKIINIMDDKYVWDFIPKRKTSYDEIDYTKAINELNNWILNDLNK